MLKTYELLNNVEIQVAIHYCYYDFDSEERIEITHKEACDKEIKYLYCEDNEIYIEVNMED